MGKSFPLSGKIVRKIVRFVPQWEKKVPTKWGKSLGKSLDLSHSGKKSSHKVGKIVRKIVRFVPQWKNYPSKEP